MIDVKICGLSEPETLDVALAQGARFVGLVFFSRSPRNVSLPAAAALAARARGRADVVAVTVDAEDALLADIAGAVAPDWVQAHGRESPRRLAEIRRYARKGVMRAVPVATAADLQGLDALATTADMFVFDAKPPAGAELPGGNGASFDWRLLSGFRSPRPWMLSGGLTPANVEEAVRESGARLVDVSSGVERAPGVKDAAAIGAFIEAARKASSR